ncbi:MULTISPECIES: hypothetical protein [unclassified Bradyrhizobium]|uniref:hypothetical protein n=1 Tax=unclassified Bradyrhizobium TaxID=2631580 RepID=UPI002478AA24|nr:MULTISPECIES: hypothetical protein [unclassified Bradyrhizobium]WGS23113.1 hypothetical protein MTX22_16610 [Bradyrhizobium sp. ISRA463]WGS30116.1 hypothetical protein MTX19_14340 [Bradyrhizobium sp. ISRA464]
MRGRWTLAILGIVLIVAGGLLALMRLAPKRASRAGLIGQSIVIALVSVAVGYAALWPADLAFKIAGSGSSR